MRPVRYSINVTLDGCCHHEAGLALGRRYRWPTIRVAEVLGLTVEVVHGDGTAAA